MGGKGETTSQQRIPIAYGGGEQQASELEAMMMAQMMQSMQQMAGIAAIPAPQPMPALPDIYQSPEVDWSERQEQLAQQMRADFGIDAARRHGRGKTVLSSPLLDEESADVTQSVLAGD